MGNIRLFLLEENSNEQPGDVLSKIFYNLHTSFAKPALSVIKPPFTYTGNIEVWGEFRISINCYTTTKTELAAILHSQ
ncbi:uncharacterized protein LMH87_007681 [Akanthomyces muscarius]|uniref:YEATS domain-containing protein n=1 Tax=Akanthomyces muscarius TaxID=2231603 RepID=A0A9W8QKM8_AKAMU|nr:uncharacterized protein LMH87_007681 [Akanthomyces muscarius]KAJ4161654.1 hypothetical protein LMH87_007681 [Akanthomyces muscarius]